MSKIQENLKKILETIPKNVKLVAVSKFHPAEEVIEAIKAGQNLFGENRVQEAAQKFDEIRNAGFSPELHIIGSLQRNKVKEAVRISSMIESVDRIELLNEIEKQCSKINKKIQILFEIHTGEESKSGFTAKTDLEEAVQNFRAEMYPHIEIKGFMTMAPFSQDTELVRKSFSTLKKLQQEFAGKFSEFDFSELSMGMSGDYKIAIEEGSTMVRIGTAIFGERNYSK